MKLQKNINNKKCGSKFTLINENYFWEISIILDGEQWLWKLDFSNFWQLTTMSIQPFSFEYIDLWYNIWLILYPSLWNLTTYTFQLGQGLILQTESCLLRFLSNTIQNDLVVKVQAKTCLLNAGPPGLYYLGFCDWFQLDNGCNLPDLFWFFHLERTCPNWSGERAMLWPLWVWCQLGYGVF